MLTLAGLFHLNLMYSSIAAEQRVEVIRRCYHPLLDLAAGGVPVSLEATAVTLEMIAADDPGWLERLRALIAAGNVEFIGSGRQQIVGPLAPVAVNRANFAAGLAGYNELLGVAPEIWLVNEMAWSDGLVGLYAELGVRAVIMEWNNPWREHPTWQAELRYHRQLAVGPAGEEVPLLWVDTLAFQKLQRLTRGDLSEGEFLRHWADRVPATGKRYAAWYGSDAEVFDFRPGRYLDEGPDAPHGEWKRITAVLRDLADLDGVALGRFADVLQEAGSSVCGTALNLATAARPVVVKKQEKYSLTRWAVTGRDDLAANTLAHIAAAGDGWPDNDSARDRVLQMWASDFRTHITAERWRAFQKDLALVGAPRHLPRMVGKPTNPVFGEHKCLVLATPAVGCRLNLNRGLAVHEVAFPGWADGVPVLGTLPHGHFDDISLGADFYTGHAVCQAPGRTKLTDLHRCGDAVQTWSHDDGGVSASVAIQHDDLGVSKRIALAADRPLVTFSGTIERPARDAAEIHPLHLTIIPGVFDPATMGFAVCNGGQKREVFLLARDRVDHGEPYSTLVTAKSGLGATDGVIIIGDANKRLVIRHDPTVSALMPTVQFIPARDEGYLLRLRYSAQEIDETFVPADRPWAVSWVVLVTAEMRSLTAD